MTLKLEDLACAHPLRPQVLDMLGPQEGSGSSGEMGPDVERWERIEEAVPRPGQLSSKGLTP